METIVIVGSGISGLITSIVAKIRNMDHKVVVLEWNSKPGGNSRMATSGISLVNQREGDTARRFLHDIQESNHVTRYIASNSDHILKILAGIGIQFDKTYKTAMHSVARTFTNSTIKGNIGSYMVKSA